MAVQVERRQEWHRIIGVERRQAPIQELEGHTLPDPTLLLDEEFQAEIANAQASEATSEDTVKREH